MPRELKIWVQLNAYEIAKILMALKSAAGPDYYYPDFVLKIVEAVKETGITKEEFDEHQEMLRKKNN